MHLVLAALIPTALLSPAYASLLTSFPRQTSDTSDTSASYNDGIHLAVGPQCGVPSGNYSDINVGLDLQSFETIVSFGDSYTDGGREDGGPLAPPVVVYPNPEAGGRSTNGKVWVENIADDIGARLMDYAVRRFVLDINDVRSLKLCA
ncbi:carbohydrate esterase family 16 protein [Gelatoporia subvermispora B]|uniref:Carbohydrate esterase family 16 protein n=1 Tax=Ceriporiopsis subvermispora (strain B) TaxID=914234 RepID=M2PK63_CERS8|nr:carbohydrate esterase family 16 protein [Gelatoporia subvermispora B]